MIETYIKPVLFQARITNAKVFERCRFLLQRKFSENKTEDVKKGKLIKYSISFMSQKRES
jgi:hypothetical protein